MADGALSRKTLVMAAGTAAQLLISQIGVNLFLVRLVPSPEVFGTYRQIWLLLNTLFPILLLGLHFGAYFYLPALPPASRRSFVARSTLVLLGVGVVAAATAWVTADSVARYFSNPLLAEVLRASTLYLALALPTSFLFHAYVAVDRQVRAVVWNLVFFIPQSVLIVALVWRGISLEHLFVVLGALAVMRGLVALWEIRHSFPGGMPATAVSLRTLLIYSIPVGMAEVVAILGEKLDKFVVSAALNPEQFAFYSVGAVEFPLSVLLATAAITVMRPRIAAHHHANDPTAIYRFWRVAYRKLAMVLIPTTVLLGILADPLMRFLYTDTYSAAAGVFRIYLLVTLMRIAPPEPLLSSTGRTRMVFWGGVGFLILDLALNLVFIRQVGFLGPPIATALSMLALHLFYLTLAARSLRVSLSSMFPMRLIAPFVGLAAGAGLPVLWMLGRSWTPGTTLILGGSVFLALYGGLGWGLGAIRPEDVEFALPGKWRERLAARRSRSG